MPSMARKVLYHQGLFFHVFNRSLKGEVIFQKPDDFKRFSQLLQRYQKEFKAKIFHWVIMSNHFHLLMNFTQSQNISPFMASLQRAYTHYFNRTRTRRGYLWQGRFKSQPVEGGRYFRACARYIEQNPVRSGMVRNPEDYPYSSAAFYGLGHPDDVTSESEFFKEFIYTNTDARRAYLKFIQDDPGNEEKSLFNFEGPAVGERFLRQLQRDGYRFKLRAAGRHMKTANQGQERRTKKEHISL